MNTEPPNKGMKQTKPAQAMELRSLSPVFDGPQEVRRARQNEQSVLELHAS